MGLFSFLKRDDAAAAAAPKKSAVKSGAKASAAEDVQVLRIRARRRLIGAAVLVAAGVVGFPLIF
jgi:DedD protein